MKNLLILFVTLFALIGCSADENTAKIIEPPIEILCDCHIHIQHYYTNEQGEFVPGDFNDTPLLETNCLLDGMADTTDIEFNGTILRTINTTICEPQD